MRKINLFICLLVAALVFTGCSKNGGTAMNNSGSQNTGIMTKEKENTEGNEGANQSDISMIEFFLKDGSKAHYLGEGNEFAELDIEVAHPFKDYVIVYENNGGSLVRHIYKIAQDEILILDSKIVDYKEDFPTLEELDAMEPSGVYLKKPFSKGTVFDKWSIVETDVTLKTPYKTFDRAFIIERKDKDIVNRKYFVQGYGEVKREAVMQTKEGEFIVTSTLKAVDD